MRNLLGQRELFTQNGHFLITLSVWNLLTLKRLLVSRTVQTLLLDVFTSKHGVSTFRPKLLVRAGEEFGHVHLGTVTVQDEDMLFMCQNSMDP